MAHAGRTTNLDGITNNDTGNNNHIKFTIGDKSFEKTIDNVASSGYAATTKISTGTYSRQIIYGTFYDGKEVELSNIKLTVGKYYLVYLYIVYYTTGDMDFHNTLTFPILYYETSGGPTPGTVTTESQVSLVFNPADFWYNGWSEYSNFKGNVLVTFKPGTTSSKLKFRFLGTTSGRLDANYGVMVKEIA